MAGKVGCGPGLSTGLAGHSPYRAISGMEASRAVPPVAGSLSTLIATEFRSRLSVMPQPQDTATGRGLGQAVTWKAIDTSEQADLVLLLQSGVVEYIGP